MSTKLSTYSYRKVLPIDYKLFQVAGLICTLELGGAALVYIATFRWCRREFLAVLKFVSAFEKHHV